MRAAQHGGGDARREGAGAPDLDPVVEHGHCHVTTWIRVVAVHDRVEQDLPERVRRNGKTVFALDPPLESVSPARLSWPVDFLNSSATDSPPEIRRLSSSRLMAVIHHPHHPVKPHLINHYGDGILPATTSRRRRRAVAGLPERHPGRHARGEACQVLRESAGYLSSIFQAFPS